MDNFQTRREIKTHKLNVEKNEFIKWSVISGVIGLALFIIGGHLIGIGLGKLLILTLVPLLIMVTVNGFFYYNNFIKTSTVNH